MSSTQARREMSRLDVIRLLAFSMLLILPATSGAQQLPPIAEQMAKTSARASLIGWVSGASASG